MTAITDAIIGTGYGLVGLVIVCKEFLFTVDKMVVDRDGVGPSRYS